MNVTITQREAVTVITLQGNLMGGPDATSLNATIHDLIEKGSNRIVIDLSGVEFMNSSGLGLLLGTASAVRNSGGSLTLASASKKVETIIKIAKLESVLEVHPSLEDAIAHVKK
ncbi:MAG: STAS domain-containing protein [Bacteroidetes bacterium]|nr:STAS domain-containing protein [Bacteroidota bacterium]